MPNSAPINAAAQNLYASQSNLSTAIKELEIELGITIFTRSNRGVTLTNDGTELLGYARQVIQQADMLSERYAKGSSSHARLTVSTQHYAFSVQAFVEVAEMYTGDEYEFTLRECRTGEIIDDVRTFRSEIGILFRDSFNSRVLDKAFADANVVFTPLFDAQVHVFVGEHHPLAKAKSSRLLIWKIIRATPLSRVQKTPSITPKSHSIRFPIRRKSAYPCGSL